MKVTRKPSYEKVSPLKVGEVITLDLMVGSEQRKRNASVFSAHYSTRRMMTLLVLALQPFTLLNLETKETFELSKFVPSDLSGSFNRHFRTTLKEKAEKICVMAYFESDKQKDKYWKKYSLKLAIYPSFEITSVNLTSESLNGVQDITFSFDRIESIRLSLPRYKEKHIDNFW